MDHPSKEWRNEAVFPYELIDKKKRLLDRDVRFAGVDLTDEDDLWKCLTWELYRTITFCEEMPLSLDKKSEFPFYVPSFPRRAYLSHDINQRCLWKRFKQNDFSEVLPRQCEDIDEHEDNLLNDFGTNEEIHNITPITHGIRRWIRMGFRKRKKEIRSLARKLELKIYVNPNWTKSKLKALFEKQIIEIYDKIQFDKQQLEKERRIVPHVFLEFTPDMKEEEFRQLVQEQTKNVCRVMESDKKYFVTDPIEFEKKEKSLIPKLKSRLKLLGHYRLRYCVGLGWRETVRAYQSKSHKSFECEDTFKLRIRNFRKLPCD